MNETGYKYMYLLARYFNERLLYRVSVSQYKENFLLKGGSLLYAMDGLGVRPTVDIDFMADRINSDATDCISGYASWWWVLSRWQYYLRFPSLPVPVMMYCIHTRTLSSV